MFSGQQVAGSSIDSVACVRAVVDWRPWANPTPTGTFTVVYVNRRTGTTFGSCPLDSSALSPRTLDLLRQTLESAEQDFGETVFQEGATSLFDETSTGPLDQAESQTGIGRSR